LKVVENENVGDDTAVILALRAQIDLQGTPTDHKSNFSGLSKLLGDLLVAERLERTTRRGFL